MSSMEEKVNNNNNSKIAYAIGHKVNEQNQKLIDLRKSKGNK